MFYLSPYEKNTQDAFKRVSDEYGSYLKSDCIKLDEGISAISDKIIEERKKLLQKTGDKFYVDALEVMKHGLEYSFINNLCRDKIEQKRLVESGKLITKQAIKQEESVLKKNEREQFLYIGLGSLVLLVGLYLIVKK